MKINVTYYKRGYKIPVNGKVHNPYFEAMQLDAQNALAPRNPYYRLVKGNFSAEVESEILRRLNEGWGEDQAYRP